MVLDQNQTQFLCNNLNLNSPLSTIDNNSPAGLQNDLSASSTSGSRDQQVMPAWPASNNIPPSGGLLARVGDILEEDNLLYTSIEGPTVFTVQVLQTEASLRCGIRPDTLYALLVTPVSVSLTHLPALSSPILFTWPYRSVRRYGSHRDGFSLEAGRKCASGPGLFSFISDRGVTIFDLVSSHVKALKENQSIFNASNKPTILNGLPNGQHHPLLVPPPTPFSNNNQHNMQMNGNQSAENEIMEMGSHRSPNGKQTPSLPPKTDRNDSQQAAEEVKSCESQNYANLIVTSSSTSSLLANQNHSQQKHNPDNQHNLQNMNMSQAENEINNKKSITSHNHNNGGQPGHGPDSSNISNPTNFVHLINYSQHEQQSRTSPTQQCTKAESRSGRQRQVNGSVESATLLTCISRQDTSHVRNINNEQTQQDQDGKICDLNTNGGQVGALHVQQEKYNNPLQRVGQPATCSTTSSPATANNGRMAASRDINLSKTGGSDRGCGGSGGGEDRGGYPMHNNNHHHHHQLQSAHKDSGQLQSSPPQQQRQSGSSQVGGGGSLSSSRNHLANSPSHKCDNHGSSVNEDINIKSASSQNRNNYNCKPTALTSHSSEQQSDSRQEQVGGRNYKNLKTEDEESEEEAIKMKNERNNETAVQQDGGGESQTVLNIENAKTYHRTVQHNNGHNNWRHANEQSQQSQQSPQQSACAVRQDLRNTNKRSDDNDKTISHHDAEGEDLQHVQNNNNNHINKTNNQVNHQVSQVGEQSNCCNHRDCNHHNHTAQAHCNGHADGEKKKQLMSGNNSKASKVMKEDPDQDMMMNARKAIKCSNGDLLPGDSNSSLSCSTSASSSSYQTPPPPRPVTHKPQQSHANQTAAAVAAVKHEGDHHGRQPQVENGSSLPVPTKRASKTSSHHHHHHPDHSGTLHPDSSPTAVYHNPPLPPVPCHKTAAESNGYHQHPASQIPHRLSPPQRIPPPPPRIESSNQCNGNIAKYSPPQQLKSPTTSSDLSSNEFNQRSGEVKSGPPQISAKTSAAAVAADHGYDDLLYDEPELDQIQSKRTSPQNQFESLPCPLPSSNSVLEPLEPFAVDSLKVAAKNSPSTPKIPNAERNNRKQVKFGDTYTQGKKQSKGTFKLSSVFKSIFSNSSSSNHSSMPVIQPPRASIADSSLSSSPPRDSTPDTCSVAQISETDSFQFQRPEIEPSRPSPRSDQKKKKVKDDEHEKCDFHNNNNDQEYNNLEKVTSVQKTANPKPARSISSDSSSDSSCPGQQTSSNVAYAQIARVSDHSCTSCQSKTSNCLPHCATQNQSSKSVTKEDPQVKPFGIQPGDKKIIIVTTRADPNKSGGDADHPPLRLKIIHRAPDSSSNQGSKDEDQESRLITNISVESSPANHHVAADMEHYLQNDAEYAKVNKQQQHSSSSTPPQSSSSSSRNAAAANGRNPRILGFQQSNGGHLSPSFTINNNRPPLQPVSDNPLVSNTSSHRHLDYNQVAFARPVHGPRTILSINDHHHNHNHMSSKSTYI